MRRIISILQVGLAEEKERKESQMRMKDGTIVIILTIRLIGDQTEIKMSDQGLVPDRDPDQDQEIK